MAELTPEQHRVSRIVDSFTEPPTTESRLVRLLRGLKERFGVGKYITRLEVRGGVGDILDIRMGKVPLNEFLPPGVKFRGHRHVGKEQRQARIGYNSTSWHFYRPATREIGLAVECESNAPFKLDIRSTPIAGLAIIHEMGHAWVDNDNPEDRAILIKNNLPVVILRSINDEQLGQWYQRGRSEATHRGRVDSELLRRLIGVDILGQARRTATELRLEETDLGRLVSPSQFHEIAEEIGRAIAEQVLAKGTPLDERDLVRSVQGVRQISDYLRKQFMRKESLDSEAKAWMRAEDIAKVLKKRDPKISFWDGDEKSLLLLKAFMILHHEDVKFKDLPEGEIKTLLRGITKINKIYD